MLLIKGHYGVRRVGEHEGIQFYTPIDVDCDCSLDKFCCYIHMHAVWNESGFGKQSGDDGHGISRSLGVLTAEEETLMTII